MRDNSIFLTDDRHSVPWYTKILLLLRRRQYSIDAYNGGYTVVSYKTLFDVIYISWMSGISAHKEAIRESPY